MFIFSIFYLLFIFVIPWPLIGKLFLFSRYFWSPARCRILSMKGLKWWAWMIPIFVHGCFWGDSLMWVLSMYWNHNKSLYRVISVAPANATTVPNIFACEPRWDMSIAVFLKRGHWSWPIVTGFRSRLKMRL